MSNSLDHDQARRFVRSDLGQNCLPRLSVDDTGRQRVKASENTKTLLQDAIRSLDCLKSSTWFVVVLETFAYVLLIGRLLHDSMTQSVMTQQMIGFLASSADIMEFFSLFEEEKVAQNSKATLFVLVFWTFSFFQFIPIWGSHKLGKTETKLKALPFDTEENKRKYYLPFYRHQFENECSCNCDDSQPAAYNVPDLYCLRYCVNTQPAHYIGDSTERYETGFAYVFQDGPFLVLRVYFILSLNLFTQSMFFFSLKNFALSVLLLSKFKCDFFNFLSLSIQIAVIVIIVGIVA